MTNYEFFATQDVILRMTARIEDGSSIEEARKWADEELEDIAMGEWHVQEEELREAILDEGYDPDKEYNAETDIYDEESHIRSLAEKFKKPVETVRFVYTIVGRDNIENSMQFAEDEMQRLAVLQEQVRGK